MDSTFLTTFNIKSIHSLQMEKKVNFNLRDKICNILKSFTQKQLLLQAVNNIGIPKQFINLNFIQGRSSEQLSKIYKAICTLKKQISRIKRYSDTPQLMNIHEIKIIQSFQQSNNRNSDSNYKPKKLFSNKQLSLEKRIKFAIEKQLENRQILEKRKKKLEISSKIKSQFNDKKKSIAKIQNKKSIEIYQKQKDTQDQWFSKIINHHSQINQSINQFKNSCKTTHITKRTPSFQYVQKKLEQNRLLYQSHIKSQIIERSMKQTFLKQKQKNKAEQINQKIQQKRIKTQQIQKRKNNYSFQQQKSKIKKLIQKQTKIIKSRQYKNNKTIKNSQSKSSTFITTINLKNNHFHSINHDKNDQKENFIFNKIEKKNTIRQNLLNFKVQKMNQKHKNTLKRLQQLKKSKLKQLLTEQSINQSFILQQINLNLQKKNKYIEAETETFVTDVQQQYIRQKHKSIMKTRSCNEAILQLIKLPKSALQKKLKEINDKERENIIAKNVVGILK